MRSSMKAVLAVAGIALASPAMAASVTSAKEPGGSFGYYAPRDSVVTIGQTGTVTRVQVDMDRFYMNSLADGGRITLTHNGKSIILLDTDKCTNTLNKITIRDDSGTPYSGLRRTTCNGAANDFRPSVALSAFNGMDMAGEWKLTVVDLAGVKGSTGGTMSNFSLTVAYDTPIWTTDSWGAWSETCGTATRTRIATCKIGTTAVADSQCNASVKPDTTETSTQTSGCTYSWLPGTWAPVYEPNSRCGAKTESTTYTCRRSDGVTVADSSCTATKPSSSRAYTDPIQCTYSWSTGAWYTANPTTCGTATRTRYVSCYEDTNNGVHQGDEKCLATAPKPASSEVVSDYSQCGYGWYRTGYELSPCIAAKQTYRAYYSCKRADGTTADGFCGTNPPRWVVTQSCGYWRESWGTGGWFGGIYPGFSTGIGSYSAGGTTNGTGIVSGGADGQGGDAVGIGNSSAGSGGTGGSGGVGTGGNTGPSKTGGTYDPINNIYVDQLGNRYQGGYYDSTTGNYYGGSLIKPESPDGSVIMMRRPVPIAPR